MSLAVGRKGAGQTRDGRASFERRQSHVGLPARGVKERGPLNRARAGGPRRIDADGLEATSGEVFVQPGDAKLAEFEPLSA